MATILRGDDNLDSSKVLSEELAGSIVTDASGRVTMPYQPWAVASTINTIYAGSTIPLDANIDYTGIGIGTHQFTVPVAGTYIVGYAGLGNSGSGACQMYITKNGVKINGSIIQDMGNSNDNFSCQTPVRLAANDFITFYCNSGAIHGNNDYNRFYIYKIA